MKIWKLRGIFIFILVSMLIVTTWATSIESVFTGGGKLLREPWGIATLFDTYFAFLTFFFWVCYRERKVLVCLGWFVAIMLLGNIAMATYVLLVLRKFKAGQDIGDLLFKPQERRS